MRLMPRLGVFLWCCGLLLAWAVPVGAAAAGMERDVHTVATLEMRSSEPSAAWLKEITSLGAALVCT